MKNEHKRLNHRFSLLIIVSSATIWSANAAPTNGAVITVDDMMKTTNIIVACSQLSPNQKMVMIDQLKASADTRQTGKRQRLQLLVELGDAEAISNSIAVFRSGNRLITPDGYESASRATRRFMESAQPILIPLMAEELFHEESADMVRTHFNPELGNYPTSVSAALVIRSVVMNSSLFNPDVRAWARAIGEKRPDELRKSMRSWWIANKQAFERSEFGSVRAGSIP